MARKNDRICYRNKDSENSRNGHSDKSMHASYEGMESDAMATMSHN